MRTIHVYLTGRLGNQLFQYAFARKLQKQYGGKIICNIYDLEHNNNKIKNNKGKSEKFQYDMSNYILNDNVEIEDRKLPWYADFNNFLVKVIKKIFPRLYFELMAKFGYLIWQRDDYINIPKICTSQITICGWWQDFRFFNGVNEQLSNEIVPKTLPVQKNKEMYELAKNKESVCISIRGGNYLVPKIKELLFVCDRDYFYTAIEQMNLALNKPEYLIFSDDLDWVRSYLRLEEKFPNYKFHYESGEDSVEEKIRMMTACNNFIISNSSFSWWAQYLSKNKNKIVMAPNAWFADGRQNGLYMKDWILLPGRTRR